MFAKFSLSSRVYLILIGFILSLDYLGPLFSHEITIKLVTLFILFIFLYFLKTTTLKKIVASFFLLLLCLFLPFSLTYTSLILVAMLLVHLYCAEEPSFYCASFTITFLIITISYNTIPLIFNTIELISCLITKTITFGTPLGCQGSFLIPIAATFIALLAYLYHDKANGKIILINMLLIMIFYLVFINFNVYILFQSPIVGLLFIPVEVIIITNLIHELAFSKQPTICFHFRDHQKFLNVIILSVTMLFIVSIVSLLYFPSLGRVTFKTKNISIISSEEPFANANQEISRKDTIGFGNTPFIFSGFKSYLEFAGHKLTVLDSLSNVDYKQTDVIILIHYNSDSNTKVINEVKNFVNSGGIVIAFNDHNNLFNATNKTNLLLSFAGIAVNDDISDNIIKSSGVVWQNSLYEFQNSPVLTQLKSSSELNLGVWGGASVKAINLFATPLIIAKNGISDPSLLEPNKNGEYMGNRTFDYGDGYGNIPLGYAINYGSGCVAIYGDASYIQVPQSMYNWKLLYNTININSKNILSPTIQLAFTLFLFSVLINLLNILPYLLNARRKILLLSLSVILLMLFANYFIIEYAIDINIKNSFKNVAKKYNIIDSSSNNYFSTALTKSNSVGGVGYISMTQEQPIFLIDKLYNKENINKFIIINPCKKVDSILIDELLANGTDVLIISGKEYSHNIIDIMRKYELSFNSFVGPIPWKNPMISNSNIFLNNKPEFKEAWDLDYNGDIAVPLFEYNGYVPAICIKTDGGNLYMIADSRFIDNNNLEGEFEGKINNIKLLEDIFKQ